MTARRRRTWIVLATALCFLFLVSDAVTHHHKTREAQLLCPVCQAVGHGQVVVPTPDALPLAIVATVVFVGIPPHEGARLLYPHHFIPPGRGPPAPVS